MSSDEDGIHGSDDSGSDIQTTHRRSSTAHNDLDQSKLIVETSFDAYFVHAAKSSKTSSSVFTSVVPPLTNEEYADAIATSSACANPLQSRVVSSEQLQHVLFVRFEREMREGFNLLFYGYGSKRSTLNQLALRYSRLGHVFVVNGFKPDLSVRDIFTEIESSIPGLTDIEFTSTSSGIEVQAERINHYFSPSKRRQSRLFIVIHNIDAPIFRLAKVKSPLALLAQNPRIHFVASIDKLTAPLLWSSSDISTRKRDDDENLGASSSTGFAWLWHDLTTLLPYDFELTYADRSSISGASGIKLKDGAIVAGATAQLTETAAIHILASVTQKAKKLFILMGTRQLEAVDAAVVEGEQPSGGGTGDMQQYAISYDTLFHAAREDFIATNDTSLRSLLGEFRDHELVLGATPATQGGEVLWIPLRKDRLCAILTSLQSSN